MVFSRHGREWDNPCMSEQIEGELIESPDPTLELRREAYEMALYVAICLLAALSAATDEHTSEVKVFGIVWGTTVGLALAHWFAFNVSSRLVTVGHVHRRQHIIVAELAGAASVAVVATVPILLLPQSVEYAVVRVVLALFIGVIGYQVGRSSGADRAKSIVYALAVFVIAAIVVVIKNFLLGH